MTRILYISILSLICCFTFLSCRQQTSRLTQKDAMQFFKSHPADSSSMFYAQQRNQYPFLDTLFIDSILPALEACSYFELKASSVHLSNTPVGEYVHELCQFTRKRLLDQIARELEEYNKNEQELFVNNMIPMIDLGLDSIAQKNSSQIVSEYAGGLLNFRKLYFLAGVGVEKFDECWHNIVIAENYEHYILSCVNDYCQMIIDTKLDYIAEFTDPQYTFYILEPPVSVELSLNKRVTDQVIEFTTNERNDLFISALKDVVAPFLLYYVGSSISYLYESVNLGYDLYTATKEDLEGQDYDANSLLADLCSEDIENQIQLTVMPKLIKDIRKTIHSLNQQTYNYLERTI